VIFPAYVVDRWLFDRGRGRLADDLFAVNTVMLLIFLVLGGVTFRLVDRVVDDRGIAAFATIACLLSLPLASFAFQFYPETLGAVLVAGVTARSFGRSPLSRTTAVLIGIALGWLVWLQVRFALLAGTLFVWVLWRVRSERRVWLPIIGVAGLLVGLFCFYVYHVTGSLLPSALYSATPDPGFRTSRLPIGLVGVLFDRENGLFALAPVFLMALPGLGVMFARHRESALMVLTLFLSLLIPVAGHGYETSGTSPLRHMVAVVPLAAVPVAVWLHSVRGRPLLQASAIVVVLISIQMAVAYDLHNDKTITQTIASGISGWDPSFVFPLLRRTVQAGFDRRALALWEIASVASVFAAMWCSRSQHELLHRRSAAATPAIAVSLGIVALLGWVAVAAGGPRRELRLLKTPQQSVRECRLGCTGAAGTAQIGEVPNQ
jgi:hypothetical protein